MQTIQRFLTQTAVANLPMNTGVRVLLVVCTLCASAASLPAQEGAHHHFLQMEREALGKGEGFGMALAADRNGFPGPRHLLELKEELRLTPEQVSAISASFREMQARAKKLGHAILDAEDELDRLFASRRASEVEVREKVKQIALLRADLRMTHLGAHLAVRPLLTPEQLTAYARLRAKSQ